MILPNVRHITASNQNFFDSWFDTIKIKPAALRITLSCLIRKQLGTGDINFINTRTNQQKMGLIRLALTVNFQHTLNMVD